MASLQRPLLIAVRMAGADLLLLQQGDPCWYESCAVQVLSRKFFSADTVCSSGCRCGTQLQALCADGAPSREDIMKAVESVRWAERLVVTGEALTQRLLGRRQLVESLLQSCINDTQNNHTGNIPEGQNTSPTLSQ